jgi:hypothetical protein
MRGFKMKKAVKVSYEVRTMGMVSRKVEVIDAPTKEESVINWLYKQIGCKYVDVAYLPDNILAWVDDEGYYASNNVVADYAGAVLAGTVIFSKSETGYDGETTWLDSVEIIDKAIDMAENAKLVGVTNG